MFDYYLHMSNVKSLEYKKCRAESGRRLNCAHHVIEEPRARLYSRIKRETDVLCLTTINALSTTTLILLLVVVVVAPR
jgi:hypothetical protein